MTAFAVSSSTVREGIQCGNPSRVTPDLYKYKALRLSYENASIFAAFALVAFIPGLFLRHD